MIIKGCDDRAFNQAPERPSLYLNVGAPHWQHTHVYESTLQFSAKETTYDQCARSYCLLSLEQTLKEDCLLKTTPFNTNFPPLAQKSQRTSSYPGGAVHDLAFKESYEC